MDAVPTCLVAQNAMVRTIVRLTYVIVPPNVCGYIPVYRSRLTTMTVISNYFRPCLMVMMNCRESECLLDEQWREQHQENG